MTNNSIKSNKPNRITKKAIVVFGSEKEFVITEDRTRSPGHGAACECLELSLIPLSYSGAPPAIHRLKMRWITPENEQKAGPFYIIK